MVHERAHSDFGYFDAFKRSSHPNADSMNKDASSSLLWRFPPRRVEAEVIRDGILLASGKLNRKMGGKSYRIHNVKKTYAQWKVIDNFGPETLEANDLSGANAKGG